MDILYNWPFWVVVTSLISIVVEKITPWRLEQPFWRRSQIQHDWFFFFLNNFCVYPVILFVLPVTLIGQMEKIVVLNLPGINLTQSHLVIQIFVLMLFKDFWEWCIHNCLHRIPFLWKLHELHHSITTMDWIGNYRFHWMEIVVYRTCSWLPLLFLQCSGVAILVVGVVSMLIGNLNHSNCRFDWGPLRYVLNSPRLHIWHHDVVCHKPCGQNFAIVFSLWDWLFGTIWYPAADDLPQELGFKGSRTFPKTLIARLLYPFVRFKG